MAERVPEHLPPRTVVLAAGTVPWRVRDGRLEVLLVHRPRFDDWGWPKGKLDPGEASAVAAVRETLEETGLLVRLGLPLPQSTYDVPGATADGVPRLVPKVVDYWAAEVVGGDGHLANEIDEVAWLDPAAADARLDYRRDVDQLRAVVRAHAEGRLRTWPLLVVRHAKAVGRSSWTGPDQERPLDTTGEAHSKALVPLLHAFAPRKVVTSPSARCADTVRPYADAAGLSLRERDGLSEEGHAAEPHRAGAHTLKLLRRGRPVVLCSHGPVLPAVLDVLAGAAVEGSPEQLHLLEVADLGLAKGEVLAAHVSGRGEDARVVAVERHDPT